MADTKQLKIKIQSTKNIKKITNAMEVISTIKVQKMKKKAEGLRTYMNMFISMVSTIDTYADLFPVVASTATRELVIVVSSEKGLCGSLNSGLFKQLDAIYADRKDTLDIYTIGKKATEYCAKRGYTVVGSLSVTDNLESTELDALISYIDTAHTSNIYTSMSVMYNYFKNTMKQIPVVFQLFPLSIEKCTEFFATLEIVLPSVSSQTNVQNDMILEPDRDAIVAQAYHILMNVIVYGAILHNKTGEFAARMLAMKGAKDNATSMIKSLSLSYNKARQDAITKEVLEIVSAKTVIEN